MQHLDRRNFLYSSAAVSGAALLSGASLAEPPSGAGARKFKLGTVTYNIAKDWDLPTLLDVCRKTGLAAVELRTTHKHGVEPSLSSEARQEVRKRFADSGVVCWGCGTVCEFHAPDAEKVRENIETCKRFIQLSADIGGKGVKVRPNGLSANVPVEKTLAQIGSALVECGKAAAEAGLEIWLEVHGSGTSIPKNIKTIMDHCGHPAVGLTWNSNQTDRVRGSVAEAFAMLKPWIRSCHINDLYNDEKGVYPYRELFRLLREAGYDRYTMCEVGRAMPDLASGIEFLRYYHALWHELSS
jgi:sugar phosphate isomerase/epimerase